MLTFILDIWQSAIFQSSKKLRTINSGFIYFFINQIHLGFNPYSFSFNSTFSSTSFHRSGIFNLFSLNASCISDSHPYFYTTEQCQFCCKLFFFQLLHYNLVFDKHMAFTVTVQPVRIPGLTFIFHFCTKTSIYTEGSKSFQNWGIIGCKNDIYKTQPSHPQSTTLLHKQSHSTSHAIIGSISCKSCFGTGQNCGTIYIKTLENLTVLYFSTAFNFTLFNKIRFFSMWRTATYHHFYIYIIHKDLMFIIFNLIFDTRY